VRWGRARSIAVSNFSTADLDAVIAAGTIPADDMAELDALDQTGGTDRALEANWWS
jgi:hypothetical protein